MNSILYISLLNVSIYYIMFQNKPLCSCSTSWKQLFLELKLMETTMQQTVHLYIDNHA